jgi:hypothetical protein
MSGASQAVDALQAAAQAAYRSTFEAGSHFARAHSNVRVATDLVDTMARTIDLIAAIEALHDAADAGVGDLRAALATVMSETGATKVEGTHHVAYLARKAAFVSINQETAIPPEFVVQRTSIDKAAIKTALKDGAEVPGASLIQPNDQTLVLRSRKEPTP